MYKIMQNLTTPILKSLLTETRAEKHSHNVRSRENSTTPQAKTTSYQQSFFPTATRLWNELPYDQRNISSLEAFKESLEDEKIKRPQLYCGRRDAQILHSRIRLECSDLKVDLDRLRLTDDIECACGAERESAEHYLLNCNLYNIHRQAMFNDLPSNIAINTNTLMYGDPSLEDLLNIQIVKAVQKFILSTNRFNKTPE
jgi:hypothetical protein